MALFALEDVTVVRAGRVVLGGLDLAIAEGATAVVGASGVGKSTLLRLLNRLTDPHRGVVRYRDRDVRDLDVLALRREVGLVPQLPALLPGSVADNVRYAARLAGRPTDVTDLLAAVALPAELAAREATGLSVGEQQRVMLARALATGPRVLLLDEPTAALDEHSRAIVERTLLELRARGDLSLIVVTHDRAQAARLAERVVAVPSPTFELAVVG
jgi:putative ABC transport system ATP-binding protein